MDTQGRALVLVDTAAQRGLIGEKLYQSVASICKRNVSFGRSANKDGGTVRGISGAEEKTPIAYGSSGLLRVQSVPGFLDQFHVPAYILCDVGIMIDVVGLRVSRARLGDQLDTLT